MTLGETNGADGQDPGRVFPESRPSDAAQMLGPYGSWPYVERRRGGDRRLRATPLVSWFTLIGGGRMAGRRSGERQNIYVDRYATRDLAGVIAILVLNILDAWLTLLYLGYGGSEANPVARYLLETGIDWFVGAKSFLVSVCLLFLAVHKTFNFVRPAIRVLVWFYGGLLVYHMILQATAVVENLT